MVRRFHLHLDVSEADALTIKDAAKLGGLRPSLYVIDRALRVAEQELEAHRQLAPGKTPPEDIDAGAQQMAGGGTDGGGGVSVLPKEPEAENETEDYLARLARYRKKKGPNFRVAPLV